ncbi:hypothetical protein HK405_004004 [Cladochytrium tenue]|nr:hypothetical protein HK405_004004 [Cladochytrium tenue]
MAQKVPDVDSPTSPSSATTAVPPPLLFLPDQDPAGQFDAALAEIRRLSAQNGDLLVAKEAAEADAARAVAENKRMAEEVHRLAGENKRFVAANAKLAAVNTSLESDRDRHAKAAAAAEGHCEDLERAMRSLRIKCDSLQRQGSASDAFTKLGAELSQQTAVAAEREWRLKQLELENKNLLSRTASLEMSVKQSCDSVAEASKDLKVTVDALEAENAKLKSRVFELESAQSSQNRNAPGSPTANLICRDHTAQIQSLERQLTKSRTDLMRSLAEKQQLDSKLAAYASDLSKLKLLLSSVETLAVAHAKEKAESAQMVADLREEINRLHSVLSASQTNLPSPSTVAGSPVASSAASNTTIDTPVSDGDSVRSRHRRHASMSAFMKRLGKKKEHGDSAAASPSTGVSKQQSHGDVASPNTSLRIVTSGVQAPPTSPADAAASVAQLFALRNQVDRLMNELQLQSRDTADATARVAELTAELASLRQEATAAAAASTLRIEQLQRNATIVVEENEDRDRRHRAEVEYLNTRLAEATAASSSAAAAAAQQTLQRAAKAKQDELARKLFEAEVQAETQQAHVDRLSRDLAALHEKYDAETRILRQMVDYAQDALEASVARSGSPAASPPSPGDLDPPPRTSAVAALRAVEAERDQLKIMLDETSQALAASIRESRTAAVISATVGSPAAVAAAAGRNSEAAVTLENELQSAMKLNVSLNDDLEQSAEEVLELQRRTERLRRDVARLEAANADLAQQRDAAVAALEAERSAAAAGRERAATAVVAAQQKLQSSVDQTATAAAAREDRRVDEWRRAAAKDVQVFELESSLLEWRARATAAEDLCAELSAAADAAEARLAAADRELETLRATAAAARGRRASTSSSTKSSAKSSPTAPARRSKHRRHAPEAVDESEEEALARLEQQEQRQQQQREQRLQQKVTDMATSAAASSDLIARLEAQLDETRTELARLRPLPGVASHLKRQLAHATAALEEARARLALLAPLSSSEPAAAAAAATANAAAVDRASAIPATVSAGELARLRADLDAARADAAALVHRMADADAAWNRKLRAARDAAQDVVAAASAASKRYVTDLQAQLADANARLRAADAATGVPGPARTSPPLAPVAGRAGSVATATSTAVRERADGVVETVVDTPGPATSAVCIYLLAIPLSVFNLTGADLPMSWRILVQALAAIVSVAQQQQLRATPDAVQRPPPAVAGGGTEAADKKPTTAAAPPAAPPRARRPPPDLAPLAVSLVLGAVHRRAKAALLPPLLPEAAAAIASSSSAVATAAAVSTAAAADPRRSRLLAAALAGAVQAAVAAALRAPAALQRRPEEAERWAFSVALSASSSRRGGVLPAWLVAAVAATDIARFCAREAAGFAAFIWTVEQAWDYTRARLPGGSAVPAAGLLARLTRLARNLVAAAVAAAVYRAATWAVDGRLPSALPPPPAKKDADGTDDNDGAKKKDAEPLHGLHGGNPYAEALSRLRTSVAKACVSMALMDTVLGKPSWD